MVAITQTMGNRSDTSSLLMFPLSLSFTHSSTELAICPSLQSVLMWMIYVITFWMFIVMLYSVLYSTLIFYPHTSAIVNHLQALPPMQHTINSDSTQPCRLLKPCTNCYTTQDVFISSFLVLYVPNRGCVWKYICTSWDEILSLLTPVEGLIEARKLEKRCTFVVHPEVQ